MSSSLQLVTLTAPVSGSGPCCAQPSSHVDSGERDRGVRTEGRSEVGAVRGNPDALSWDPKATPAALGSVS